MSGRLSDKAPRMNIEIVGVHPANKGALLMLEAIRAQLAPRFPNARFAVPFTWPPDQRIKYGLWATVPNDLGRVDFSKWSSLVPARLLRPLGVLLPKDIDVRLDASGFAYGDYWGPRKLNRRLVGPSTGWKRAGKSLILLPQAVGPFDKPGMAEAFRTALRGVDLAFVRDSVSMSYVEAVAPDALNIRQAPDFTNLLKPELPNRLSHLKGAALVVPNERVVQGDGESRRTYLSFLAQAVRELQARGFPVAIVLHEGSGDRALATALNSHLSTPLEVIDEEQALTTKAVISAASLVISSRFHALVSALSAAVPALACGWSHKYRELMSDYGCEDFTISLTQPSTWSERIGVLAGAVHDREFLQALSDRAAHQRGLSEMMWKDVIDLIEARQA